MAMCSPEEFADRTGEHRGLSHFEQPNPRNPPNLLKITDLAVKEFKKSAAGEILNMREKVRPPCVQLVTMNYLRDCICDQDRVPEGKSVYKYAAEDQNSHSFLDIYGFVHNRVRQIGKDFRIVGDKVSADLDFVRTTEQLCRFLIISYHDAYF